MLEVLESAPAALALRLPATREVLEPARQAMLAWLAPLGPSAVVVYRAELVLEEILVNIAWHAYPEGAPGTAWVSFAWDGSALTLTFEDEGKPFDPTTAPEPQRPASLEDARPGGLGIAMVRRFSRSMRYQRLGRRNRLEVALAA